MIILIKLIILFTIIYVLFGGVIVLLIYKETNGHIERYVDHPSNYGLKEELFTVPISEKVSLVGWFFRQKRTKALVIVCHGYSRPGGKESMTWHADYLYRAGFDVALFDYRGFGESTGTGVRFGKTESEDVKAVYDYLSTKNEYRNIPIILYGKSMGGVTVLIAAGKYRIGDAVVSAVPYKSFYSLIVNQMMKKKIPVILAKPFIRLSLKMFISHDYEEYASERQIGKITVPILLIGASQDKEINPKDFNDLYELNREDANLVWFESGHDIRADVPEDYKKTVLQFLHSRYY